MKNSGKRAGGSAKKAATPPMAVKSDEDMKWKAQDALHTLRRAEEIKSDKTLMHHVKHHAANERQHLNKIIRRKV